MEVTWAGQYPTKESREHASLFSGDRLPLLEFMEQFNGKHIRVTVEEL